MKTWTKDYLHQFSVLCKILTAKLMMLLVKRLLLHRDHFSGTIICNRRGPLNIVLSMNLSKSFIQVISKYKLFSPIFPNTGDFKLENLRGKMLTLNSIIFFIILNQLCRKPAQILFFTAIAAILTLCTSICDQVATHLLCCYPS